MRVRAPRGQRGKVQSTRAQLNSDYSAAESFFLFIIKVLSDRNSHVDSNNNIYTAIYSMYEYDYYYLALYIPKHLLSKERKKLRKLRRMNEHKMVYKRIFSFGVHNNEN